MSPAVQKLGGHVPPLNSVPACSAKLYDIRRRKSYNRAPNLN